MSSVMVAYGKLVGVLTEFPQQQKEVVAYVIQKRPELLNVQSIQPISTISYEKCDTIWKNAVLAIAPQHYEAIQEYVTKEKATS